MKVILQKARNGRRGWFASATYDQRCFSVLGLTQRGAVRRLRRCIKDEMRFSLAVEIEVPGPYD